MSDPSTTYPRDDVRPLMEEAYEDLASGKVAVVVAPTSYGKTAASRWMWRRAREDRLSGGLIHVAPLRALVRRVFEGFFRPLGGRLQMHGAEEDVRSPYFLSSLVATTLDSFLWNLYRIPVAEALNIQRETSMGHYYPALLSILTSLVVLDEAHMFLWEEPSREPGYLGAAAAVAAVGGLARAGVPVAVETATAWPDLIGAVADSAREAGREVSVRVLRAPRRAEDCPYIQDLRPRAGGAIKEATDPEWESRYLVRWETLLKNKWEEVLESVVGDASKGPVLVVANTVGEAVSLYERLKGRAGRAVLVHGRLSNEDRSKAEDQIADVERRGGVVVATQVAEAGLDVNSFAVYTSAAPADSLIQRAGRACRRGRVLSECLEDGGKVVVIKSGRRGPYPEGEVREALETLSRINQKGRLDWRAPCSCGDVRGYGELMAGSRAGAQRSVGGLVSMLLNNYLKSDARPWALLRILDEAGLCGLARDSVMVEIEVGGSRVPVSIHWALANASWALEVREGRPVVLVEWTGKGGGGMVEGVASKLWEAWGRVEEGRGCRDLVEGLGSDAVEALKRAGIEWSAYTVRLKAREGAYKPGLGLLPQGGE